MAYGQYKAPLQQFLKEALRAKAEEEEAHEAGEEDAPEASGVVMGVEQCATKVRSSLVAFEQQLAARGLPLPFASVLSTLASRILQAEERAHHHGNTLRFHTKCVITKSL